MVQGWMGSRKRRSQAKAAKQSQKRFCAGKINNNNIIILKFLCIMYIACVESATEPDSGPVSHDQGTERPHLDSDTQTPPQRPECRDQGTQTETPPQCPDCRDQGTQTPSQRPECQDQGTQTPLSVQFAPVPVDGVITKLVEVGHQVGLKHDFSDLQEFVLSSKVGFQHTGPPLQIHNSCCSWDQYYCVYSFLVNGYLYAHYAYLSPMLGLPPCCEAQWQRLVQKLEHHVTKLAEWSCGQVRQKIMDRKEDQKWTASYDGFYLTRGHYSNNSSATLHDYTSGLIAWFTHRTKRGPGHTWEGTSNGAEGDMLDDILGKVKAAGFCGVADCDRQRLLNECHLLSAFP